MEVVKLNDEDVLTTSGGQTPEEVCKNVDALNYPNCISICTSQGVDSNSCKMQSGRFPWD